MSLNTGTFVRKKKNLRFISRANRPADVNVCVSILFRVKAKY